MKKYKVEFTYLESDGSVREMEMFVPLSLPRSETRQEVVRSGDGSVERVNTILDGPWATNKEPWTGELDEDEARRLGSFRGINQHWRFVVTEVK